MSTKTYWVSLAGAAMLIALLPIAADAETASAREYQLKAAFLFNFISFVDGDRFNLSPEQLKPDKPKPPIVIGVLGKDPFGDAFEPLKGKEAKDRPVTVKLLKSLGDCKDAEGHIPAQHPDLEAIKGCHVLFICASEKDYLKNLLDPLRTHNLLTVSDVPGFIEAGGMINFIIEDNKVRFDVNATATAHAKLEIRSKLLRLARSVKTDASEGGADGGKPTQSQNK